MSERHQADITTRQSQRAWAAERAFELAPIIRNRLRRKLSGSARRLFDSQDVLSTVLRRLDRLSAEGRLKAQTDEQLLNLLLTITDNIVVDRYRVLEKLKRTEGPDGEWATQLMQRLNAADVNSGDEILASIYQSLQSDDDKIILTLWMRDLPHRVIAESIGISPDAARKRWSILRQRIVTVLAGAEYGH